MSREWYANLRTFGGLSLEYLDLVEADYTASSGSAYSPPERGNFRRIVGSRQIQLLQEAPGVIESFHTSQAEIFLPANTVPDSTNDAGDGRLFFVKNSGTGNLIIKDYLGTTVWTVQEKGSILVVGNDNNNWDFYFKAEDIYYNNVDSGIPVNNVKDAIDYLQASLESGASPGLTWGRFGNIPVNSYLLNDSVPSNTSGRIVPVTGAVVEIFVSCEENATVDFTIQKRSGSTFTDFLTISLTAQRIKTQSYTTSNTVTKGEELAAYVSSGSAKNPVIGLILIGSV